MRLLNARITSYFTRCSLTLLCSLATTPDGMSVACVQVEAVDLDVGANGNVSYSLVKSTDPGIDRFQIDSATGVIRTADVFDREAKIGVTDLGVTIKAEDHGSPTLAGFCTFRIRIGDRNDNPPVFNLHEYAASIEESSPINRKVKQVIAAGIMFLLFIHSFIHPFMHSFILSVFLFFFLSFFA